MRASDPHPKTLLLIDDDAISRELLALLLEGEGFAVLVCDSGKAALEHLRTVGLPYIALTDLHMPGISGAELAAALSPARAKGAVLLAMSASQPGEGIAEAFDGFLLKPFSPLEFRSALESSAARANSGSSSIEAATESLRADSGTPVLHAATYAKLASVMPGPQLRELYSICVADSLERVDRMRLSAAADDAAGFGKEAHAIKGGCAMLGAGEMAKIAEEMESLGASRWSRVPRRADRRSRDRSRPYRPSHRCRGDGGGLDRVI
jgi:CheY-like chemotaxis protein/HPt (histidine-containing phosphotransfer) domain-containing protein